MDNDFNYDNIGEILSNIPDNYKILEETIDIEVQKDFYESSKSLEFNAELDAIDILIENLNSTALSVADKKSTLQKLAMIDSVDAFRALEAYSLKPQTELKDWAVLSLQQSRMIMHTSLLDEQQVFISTGLGGKNDKLRYFLIFPFNEIIDINTIQKNSLEQELKYFLGRHGAELEEINFQNGFATGLALIPLKAPVAEIIAETLYECNQYGNFLSDDVIITNIKKFNITEILEIIKNHEQQNKSGITDIAVE